MKCATCGIDTPHTAAIIKSPLGTVLREIGPWCAECLPTAKTSNKADDPYIALMRVVNV